MSLNIKSGFSIIYLDFMLKIFKAGLSSKEIEVLIMLISDFANNKDMEIKATYKDIAKKYNMGEVWSQKFITKIKKLGIISGDYGKYELNPNFIITHKADRDNIKEKQQIYKQ